MATYKTLSSADVKNSRSVLNQLIDIIQEDVSGSATRKKYQVFVTGGVGPGVTSSLFQTIYDQDFSLQTANPVFDITVGVYSGSSVIADSYTGKDSTGKLLFRSASLMMREKVNIYRQFSQILLGDAKRQLSTPYQTTYDTEGKASVGGIDVAMFLCFKRLFARDEIKRETFAMKMFTSASISNPGDESETPNINQTSTSGSTIFTDVGSATSKEMAPGGEVGNIVFASDTSRNAGLLFYDQGLAVLDLNVVTSASQHMSGIIAGMNATAYEGALAGQVVMGSDYRGDGNPSAKFIPDFIVSASMDNILDHLASCRFGSSTSTAVTFQNVTNINSTLIFCKATPDEFNYSSNPTFKDSSGRIVVIDVGEETVQRTFAFITTIGLYDARSNLLACAKLSRPVEKNDENDLTMRVRLDF